MGDHSLGGRYRGRYGVLGAVMLGSILGPIDASIVNTILPTITQSFHVDISTAQYPVKRYSPECSKYSTRYASPLIN